ncbi:Na+/H+ antiporter NhaC family protein [Thalassotalea sp. LPB0316]|uniref:Na+/H+ antiporter NhaC family protein n=1 Tax=Thalassotalea sp. LPB0316 TaxID=2769490 RepID=UPI001866F50B|nr:Na+/H+ antiporter NhaC family protein [Thalassotalea sp. LPB0316]QOL25250.1 Na+/H+ antiporter NhaC family protein [Thalassotalea sp. LPB0316]
MANQNQNRASFKALIPFLVFLGLFLGTGMYLTYQGQDFAFYQLPASIAIIPAIFVALYLGKAPIEEKIGQFIRGAGHENIITMCMIYLLAGAFAVVAKATGSVDASVQLGLALFPEYLLLPGLFIVSAFIATAMGTSMGTIAAIAPIALGFVETADVSPALIAGVIISGAIFGDNLSIISDTTIAATRSQGAHMKDKFKANFKFAMPAAIICLVIFTLLGESISYQTSSDIEFIGLIPYLLILTLALLGINVFIVLTVGILTAALIGYMTSGYEVFAFISDINTGFSNMQDIFILSLFIGGLSALVKAQGGLTALTHKIESITRSMSKNNEKRAAGIGIGMLAFFTNFFTANNTVSIIVTGDTAKELATDAELTPAQSASLLDIFACISQGLIPYGAQALLLGTTMKISPVDVVTYSFYPMVLFVVVLLMFNKATK